MSTHLIGYFEAINSATLVNVNNITDDIVIKLDADRLAVPAEYNFIHWAGALGTDISRAQILTPTLQVRRMNLEVVPRQVGDDIWDLTRSQVFRPQRPISLTPTEEIRFQAAEDGSGATSTACIIALGTATLPPIPPGDIRRNRWTGTQTLTTNTWTTTTVVLDEEYEPGTYVMVNSIQTGVSPYAHRILFQGQPWRPGGPSFAAAGEATAVDYDSTWEPFLGGYAMGIFTHRTVPAVQILATAADTAQVGFFDAIRIGVA